MFEYRAEILRVIDGDTVEARIDLGFNVFVQENLRLFGIDAPERNDPSGPIAAEYLRDLITELSPIEVITIKDRREKYGRYLAVLKGRNGILLNRAMIDAGHAKEYD